MERAMGGAQTNSFRMTTEAMSRIAVVIPCYNHASELRLALESLTRQTITPTEIVVVDDASRDDPESIVNEFASRLPIHFVKFPVNRGAPAARNEGKRLTASPLLLFLDADAELVPHALETFSRALRERPDADFAYSNLWWGRKAFRAREFDPEALARRNFIHTSSLLRRSAFPGFDESLMKFQDWDLWLTMREHKSQGVWINEFLYRIEPRRAGGMSFWLPSILHQLPWPIFGWMPQEIRRSRAAGAIVRAKHRI